MEKIKLYTRDGGYVTTVTIPVFTPRADVIQWGSRVFILKDGRYVEGMLWPADVNKEFEEIEDVDPIAAEVAAQPRPEYRTGFDYGKQLSDGQFERHPTIPTEGIKLERPIRRSYKHLLCGGITRMGDAIAKTYAADPNFYGGTFCANCQNYFSFSDVAKGDFVWVDNPDEYLGGTHRVR